MLQTLMLWEETSNTVSLESYVNNLSFSSQAGYAALTDSLQVALLDVHSIKYLDRVQWEVVNHNLPLDSIKYLDRVQWEVVIHNLPLDSIKVLRKTYHNL
ncbi:hypothetical protein SDRG_17437 [Saprolegnia diclina VS20]|uniref:Uncharacterized protein n=1 Tax=Saprolegnia diclina (strain VS20) TaxID=1156394 RepID=T0PUK1_SAPDV|nr:hypothetical protein SDRG_17437 [Saprolegnia diclina VS20]EQC24670.1 hypothetical protein SDRG_17437 [Saprolegnia diclina VS20]|eukprot:XP_008621901.1 hypothetical protein SDRG_17437 [Saprolegnia diclina VS20]